ncbi:MAG: hypothetical protein ACP5D1_08250 [Bacteroidales bacterium]
MILIYFWIIEIPPVIFLAFTLGMCQESVYASIVLSGSLVSLLAWILFRRGKWKLKHVWLKCQTVQTTHAGWYR